MGKLWGRQQKFDKNGDGRLGSGEWRNWYLSTFGHDMEMAERKKVSQMEANWEDWLNGAAQVVRNAANIFLESAGMLLPPNSKKLAWQTLLYQMMAGLVEGNQWNISEHTNTNMFVGNRVFYPYRALAFDLAKISGQCSEHEMEKAILRGEPLFSDVGALTAEHCGSFWRQVIMQLPPYNEESEPEIQGGKIGVALICSRFFLRVAVWHREYGHKPVSPGILLRRSNRGCSRPPQYSLFELFCTPLAHDSRGI